MKTMIFGASGLLGKALMREWRGDEADGPGIRATWIFAMRTRPRRSGIEGKRPDWIVLAAAYTNVDDCEKSNSGVWHLP